MLKIKKIDEEKDKIKKEFEDKITNFGKMLKRKKHFRERKKRM